MLKFFKYKDEGLYIFKYGVIREGLSENVTFQDKEEPALKRAR